MSFEGPDPVSTCGCSCTKATKVSEPAEFLPGRGCDGLETCSLDGVRFSNGELQFAVPALTAGWWGHTLIYTNRLNEDTNFDNGWNWLVKEWWRLFEISGDRILVLRGSQSALWFDDSGATPAPLYGSLHQLVHDTGNNLIKLVSPNGTVTEFFDFSHGTRPGYMKRQFTPAGVAIDVTYSGTKITAIDTSFSDGTTTTLEKFEYAYVGSGTNVGQLETVTLKRKIGAGAWTDLRRVRFEYYGASDSNGSTNDLKRIVTQFECPSSSSSSSGDVWTDHDVFYFRYYKGGSSSSSSSSSGSAPYDLAHGLKLAVGPRGYVRGNNAPVN